MNWICLISKIWGDVKFVKTLLEYGATLHIKDSRGKDPRDIAVELSEFLNTFWIELNMRVDNLNFSKITRVSLIYSIKQLPENKKHINWNEVK